MRDALKDVDDKILYAIIFTEREISYLLNLLEPLAVHDEYLDSILDAFDRAKVHANKKGA